MTDTRIRETLSDIHDAVAVPPVDHDAFAGRVRRLQRRRRGLQSLAGGAALAAVVAGTTALVPLLPDSSGSPVVADRPDPGVPVVLGGHVQLLGAGGGLTDTGLSGRPIGELGDREVVLDGDRLLGVHDEPITGVVAAFVDPTGATYETTAGVIHFTGRRGQESAADDEGTLLAAGEHAYAVELDGGLVLHDAAGLHPVPLGSDGTTVDPDRVEIGGHTVVVVAGGGVQVFDTDGARRSGFLGGVTGALSADGTTYAFAPSAQELAHGMKAGLAYYDTTSGAQHRVPLAAPALDLAWLEGNLYVVTEQEGGRTLWECGDQMCEQVLTDTTDTLTLS